MIFISRRYDIVYDSFDCYLKREINVFHVLYGRKVILSKCENVEFSI